MEAVDSLGDLDFENLKGLALQGECHCDWKEYVHQLKALSPEVFSVYHLKLEFPVQPVDNP